MSEASSSVTSLPQDKRLVEDDVCSTILPTQHADQSLESSSIRKDSRSEPGTKNKDGARSQFKVAAAASKRAASSSTPSTPKKSKSSYQAVTPEKISQAQTTLQGMDIENVNSMSKTISTVLGLLPSPSAVNVTTAGAPSGSKKVWKPKAQPVSSLVVRTRRYFRGNMCDLCGETLPRWQTSDLVSLCGHCQATANREEKSENSGCDLNARRDIDPRLDYGEGPLPFLAESESSGSPSDSDECEGSTQACADGQSGGLQKEGTFSPNSTMTTYDKDGNILSAVTSSQVLGVPVADSVNEKSEENHMKEHTSESTGLVRTFACASQEYDLEPVIDSDGTSLSQPSGVSSYVSPLTQQEMQEGHVFFPKEPMSMVETDSDDNVYGVDEKNLQRMSMSLNSPPPSVDLRRPALPGMWDTRHRFLQLSPTRGATTLNQNAARLFDVFTPPSSPNSDEEPKAPSTPTGEEEAMIIEDFISKQAEDRTLDTQPELASDIPCSTGDNENADEKEAIEFARRVHDDFVAGLGEKENDEVCQEANQEQSSAPARVITAGEYLQVAPSSTRQTYVPLNALLSMPVYEPMVADEKTHRLLELNNFQTRVVQGVPEDELETIQDKLANLNLSLEQATMRANQLEEEKDFLQIANTRLQEELVILGSRIHLLEQNGIMKDKAIRNLEAMLSPDIRLSLDMLVKEEDEKDNFEPVEDKATHKPSSQSGASRW